MKRKKLFGGGIVFAVIVFTWMGAAAFGFDAAQVRIKGHLLIGIRPDGFHPAQLARPAGRYLLSVENRSGLSEVVLRLDRVNGERVYDVRVPRGRIDWRTQVDLTPGNYVLTEAGHPRWKCNIAITAE